MTPLADSDNAVAPARGGMPAARCWVAGATGYTGRAVIEALRARDIACVGHVRPDSTALPAWQATFAAIGADLDSSPWTAEAQAAALLRARPTAVFALLGTTRAREKSARGTGAGAAAAAAATYQAVDVDLTLQVLAAATALMAAGAPAPVFVYLSSLGADRPGPSAYLRARTQVEAAVRASGLPFVIARPAAISGDDRGEPRPAERLFARLGDAALSAAAAVGAGALRQRYASMDAATLARGLVRAAFTPAVHGTVVDAAWLRRSDAT